MARKRIAPLGVLAAVAALLLLPGSASAWKYTFKQFVVNPKPGVVSAGQTRAVHCGASISGDYDLRSGFETHVETSEGLQELEMEVTAVMPVTGRFQPLRDVNVRWTAKLPKDPAQRELLEKFFDRLAESQEKFWESVSVRWLQGEQKLWIHHGYLKLNGNVLLKPGLKKTPFKPKPGC